MLVVIYRHLEIHMTGLRPTHATMRKYDVILKTESTQRIATPSEEDRATATGSMDKKLPKFSRAFFELVEQTDRHTHRNSSQFAPLLGPK